MTVTDTVTNGSGAGERGDAVGGGYGERRVEDVRCCRHTRQGLGAAERGDPAGEARVVHRADAESPALRMPHVAAQRVFEARPFGGFGHGRHPPLRRRKRCAGVGGYRRHATSPHLDRLAAEGLRFEQAVAPSPWTTPSHMSLMTGLYPSTHRVNTQVEKTPARRLAPGVPTLAGRLRERVYGACTSKVCR